MACLEREREEPLSPGMSCGLGTLLLCKEASVLEKQKENKNKTGGVFAVLCSVQMNPHKELPTDASSLGLAENCSMRQRDLKLWLLKAEHSKESRSFMRH